MEVLHGGYDRDLEFGADPVIWQTESGSCKVSGIILSVAISVSDEFHVEVAEGRFELVRRLAGSGAVSVSGATSEKSNTCNT